MARGQGIEPQHQRQHQRVSFKADVDVALCEQSGETRQHFHGRSLNISMGGMFVASGAPVGVGALVRADIYPEDMLPLRLFGRVVHVREGGFGCIFTRVPQQAVARLRRWLGPCGGLAPVAGTIEQPA